ncbi:MAG: 1-aminocyclopropane-1-carboxylate deaminase/D-cysteine desulfhydrase [Myxococcota bacterium]
MRPLEDKWPRLRGLPRVELATLPTPVEPLEELGRRTGSELWVKRDDLTNAEYGGNKVRKLEYLLGEAQRRGADGLITAGAIGSHHVLATAVHAPRLELEVHAVMVPQPWNDHVEENLRCAVGAGAHLYGATRIGTAAARIAALGPKLRMTGTRPYTVPHGGSSPVGVVAYVAAGLELAAQIEARELPEPEAIYVAVGSGGTCVGLAVGLAAAGITTPVVGVRVTDRMFVNRPALATLASATVHRLRSLDPRFPQVAPLAVRHLRIDGTELGPGYGHATAEAAEAQRLARETAGLPLDTTYTAKAFAAMLRDAEASGRRLLFWHTLSSADLSERLRTAPPAPRWARRLAERT